MKTTLKSAAMGAFAVLTIAVAFVPSTWAKRAPKLEVPNAELAAWLENKQFVVELERFSSKFHASVIEIYRDAAIIVDSDQVTLGPPFAKHGRGVSTNADIDGVIRAYQIKGILAQRAGQTVTIQVKTNSMNRDYDIVMQVKNDASARIILRSAAGNIFLEAWGTIKGLQK